MTTALCSGYTPYICPVYSSVCVPYTFWLCSVGHILDMFCLGSIDGSVCVLCSVHVLSIFRKVLSMFCLVLSVLCLHSIYILSTFCLLSAYILSTFQLCSGGCIVSKVLSTCYVLDMFRLGSIDRSVLFQLLSYGCICFGDVPSMFSSFFIWVANIGDVSIMLALSPSFPHQCD